MKHENNGVESKRDYLKEATQKRIPVDIISTSGEALPQLTKQTCQGESDVEMQKTATFLGGGRKEITAKKFNYALATRSIQDSENEIWIITIDLFAKMFPHYQKKRKKKRPNRWIPAFHPLAFLYSLGLTVSKGSTLALEIL
ncbi:hypothetical protein OUZ56_021148 [Daphnia magna]|uniref:Uncharacterized protein n=1 Tax=Daphnia magna TaxID=35525 RepID=A0ABQ9ZGJ6_9CRUS|nr:hypothetical protein OUZ56_021148 [Daphnia magna]